MTPEAVAQYMHVYNARLQTTDPEVVGEPWLDGGRVRYSSGYSPGFYVDSVGGDDANDGTSTAEAVETIADALGLMSDDDNLYLARGGEWAEEVDLTTDDTLIKPYGIGDRPVIDGAGPVQETWSRGDSETYPNVWEIDVTHGWAVANGRMMIWKDGALLKRVASVALVDAEAGTYYSPGDNAWTGASSFKLYMHATSDPNSDGAVYERTQRQTVIQGAYGGIANTQAELLIVGRQGDNDGAIVLGQGSTIDRVVAYDGHKHNALQESGICKDSAFFNAQPESNYLHVFYTPDGSGLTAEFTGNIFVGQSNELRGTSGIYCHDNSGAAHATMTSRGNCFVNVNGAIASAAVATVSIGDYVENCNYALTSIASTTTTVTHLLVNGQFLQSGFASAGTHTISQAAIYSNDVTCFQLSLANWGDIRFTQSTLHIGDDDGTVTSYGRNVFRRTTGTGTLSMDRCLIIADNTDTTLATVIITDTASIGTIDDNVYFYRGNQSKASLRWSVDGTNLTFAQWQALGHDTNSIVLDEIDLTFEELLQGHPSEGDFRLQPGLSQTLVDLTPINEIGVTEHWDFNNRIIVAGAPSRWPTPPTTFADCITYTDAPTDWDFYQ